MWMFAKEEGALWTKVIEINVGSIVWVGGVRRVRMLMWLVVETQL